MSGKSTRWTRKRSSKVEGPDGEVFLMDRQNLASSVILKPLPHFVARSLPVGAVLFVTTCREGVAIVGNREGRVAEQVKALDEVADARTGQRPCL